MNTSKQQIWGVWVLGIKKFIYYAFVKIFSILSLKVLAEIFLSKALLHRWDVKVPLGQVFDTQTNELLFNFILSVRSLKQQGLIKMMCAPSLLPGNWWITADSPSLPDICTEVSKHICYKYTSGMKSPAVNSDWLCVKHI